MGPNDPCPCGSGKKYKKCHGGRLRERDFQERPQAGLVFGELEEMFLDLFFFVICLAILGADFFLEICWIFVGFVCPF